MTYRLEFLKTARKEWDKLAPTVKTQFHKKLSKILEHPHVPAHKLHGLKDCYRTKLRDVGYRLVYRVVDHRVVVEVIAVGRKDDNHIYVTATERL